jgi:hypothetical protein
MDSNCPECGNDVFSDNYLYIGNHAAYEKGYENSGFKIIGYRFYCENEIYIDGVLHECGMEWDEDI